MGSGWQIIAFPVILPWREEFWTLPFYFPDLRVGVIPGWPAALPYQGIPLPPEAEPHPQELKHYQPGDLRQWQAFRTFQQEAGEEGDLLRALRHYGEDQPPDNTPPGPDAWSLAWQLEKMQADQEAQLQLVDQGQEWLKEILQPESWEEKTFFGAVPGVGEMVDPELAKLRYRLWRRVMDSYLQGPWCPLLLGRTSRSLFLTLKGWPDWTGLRKVQISLPGVRNAAEWQQVAGQGNPPPWLGKFQDLLTALLAVAADRDDLEGPARELQEMVDREVAARWPFPSIWQWDLEVWAPESDRDDGQPVLCWPGAGAGVLPG